ncbi:MAG: hypothetical protein NTX22_04455 [Ignavibacteriales bacterium]|nr:hypothetical protein [Ignavibacteriales bacterium]
MLTPNEQKQLDEAKAELQAIRSDPNIDQVTKKSFVELYEGSVRYWEAIDKLTPEQKSQQLKADKRLLKRMDAESLGSIVIHNED